MRLLHPETHEVDPVIVYGDLPVVAGRPGVRLNMIVSVDGGTAWNGVSGSLGGPADKALFGVLRSLTDDVLVASGTMRAEAYGPATLPDEVQAARVTRGQRPVPRIAVVTRTCRFDWETPFFTEAVERPVIITVHDADPALVARASEVADVVVAGDSDVDLGRAVDALGEGGARSILAEGGPTLNGQLARAGLLDELCVSLAPLLASGDAKRIIAGSTIDALEPLELRSICEQDGYLFLRYRPSRTDRPETSLH
jgi:riboflavin biosynthesis pyrimidine reductase